LGIPKKGLDARFLFLVAAREELAVAKTEAWSAQSELKKLEPRLSFPPKLPTSVLLSILGQLGKKAGQRRALCVKREWRDVAGTAKALGLYRTMVLSVAVGGGHEEASCTSSHFTVICLDTAVFSWGGGREDSGEGDEVELPELELPELGHGEGVGTVQFPRMIEALAGKKVVGVAAGGFHTAAWTETGDLFTFGVGYTGQLGHGGGEAKLIPRLVEAVSGKKVIGATRRIQRGREGLRAVRKRLQWGGAG